MPESMQVETTGRRDTITNDFVFALTGYRPDLKFLNAKGIVGWNRKHSARGPIRRRSKATRPGIYLAGVIVAGMHTNEIFIENGRFHGHLIADSIASRLST